MNYASRRSLSEKMSGAALTAIVSGLLLASTAHAQDNLYFDPSNTGAPSGSGGNGSFPNSNYYDQSTGLEVSGFVSGDNAYFDTAAGTVSVETPVDPNYIEVGVASGTENFGTTSASSTINFPATQYHNIIQADTGSENVNFNSALNLNITAPNYNNSWVQNNSSGNIAFNGGISFTNLTGDPNGSGEPGVILYANATGSSYTISGAQTETGVSGNLPGITFSGASQSNTLTLTNTASFNNVGLGVNSGTILDQGASFTNAVIGVSGTGQYLTDADNVDVAATIQNNGSDLTVGGNLADNTSYSGVIVNYGQSGDINLTATAGGTVTFSNSVEFNSASGKTINVTGPGTVRMTYSEGSIGGREFNGTTNVKNGTFLLDTTNALSTTGSTLNIGEVLPSAITATQTYATVGGIGTFMGNVVAQGPHSILAPGDPSTIGELDLASLTANSGMTMDFKLNGEGTTAATNNDFLEIPTLSLNGLVTVNFTTSDTVSTGTPYTLIFGAGTWTAGDDLSFKFNAPAGYALDTSYGTDGYNFDIDPLNGNSLSVQFIAVPEPSIYGMLGLGLVGLVAIGRFRRLGWE